MEQFDSSEEASSRVLEQQQRNIRSAIAEKPMLYANFMALFFIAGESLTSEVYEIKYFHPFCSCDLDPMTFIYELDPYCLEMCKDELTTSSLPKDII